MDPQRGARGHLACFEREAYTYAFSFVANDPVDMATLVQGEGLVVDITCDATGSIVVTLANRFKHIYLGAPNVRGAGDVKCHADVINDGSGVGGVNKIQLTTLSGTSAANLNARVDVVLYLVARDNS